MNLGPTDRPTATAAGLNEKMGEGRRFPSPLSKADLISYSASAEKNRPRVTPRRRRPPRQDMAVENEGNKCAVSEIEKTKGRDNKIGEMIFIPLLMGKMEYLARSNLPKRLVGV